MAHTNTGVLVICIMLLAAGIETKHYIQTYSGAVIGDSIHVGAVSKLLGTSRKYRIDECEAEFLDPKAAGSSELLISDKDINEPESKAGSRETHLVAKLKCTAGNLGYKLKCGEESGIGIIEAHIVNELIVSPESSIQLELNADQADKTRYTFLRGVQGNNISAAVKSEDKSEYFEAYLGGLRDLHFYEKKDDGSLLEVRTFNFDKILPIREFDTDSQGAQKERDLISTIAVVQDDGSTVSYYDLEFNQKLGRVYVHAGNKALKVAKGYTLGHCFPALRDGRLTNYYCTYEDSDAKKQLPIVYFDIASTDDQLEIREFKAVRSVLSAKPMIDGRTCLLALNEDRQRKVLCFDARNGFDKTSDNEDSYFASHTVKVNIDGQDCLLNLDSIDPTDFRFDDAAVFECKAAKYVASFELANSYDQKDPDVSVVRSVKKLTNGTVLLCANDEEIAYLNQNSVLTLEGGYNMPGQLITYDLGLTTPVINKIHCSASSILLSLESKKSTILVDITRGNRRDSITRVRRTIDLGQAQTHMKVATSKTAILYSTNKKGQIENVVQYQGFVGFVKISNKDQKNSGDHNMIIEVSANNGSQIKQLTVRTTVLPSTEFSVKPKKQMKDLVPGHEYQLRDYFDISGQVTKIDVLSPEAKARNVFWLVDEVRFYNSTNGTARATRFVVDGCFVDTEHKKYTDADGIKRDLEADLLKPARHLGTLELEQPLALIAKRDGDKLYVQGVYLDEDRKVQSTDSIKLSTPVDEEFVRAPRLVKVDGKPRIAFYQGSKDKSPKGVAIQYQYSKEDGFKFVSLDDQKIVAWDEDSTINGYTVEKVDPLDTTSLSSCVHFQVSGPDMGVPVEYQVCGITGGSSRRFDIYNLSITHQGKTQFEIVNYPAKTAGVDSLSWWVVSSNLFDDEAGTPVNPSDLKYNATLLKRFSGLEHHTIKGIFSLGSRAVVVAEVEEDKDQSLYEIYFGERGTLPYYRRKVNDLTTALKYYTLEFALVGATAKRVYVNHAKDFSNVADVDFRDSRLRLSKHAATAQVKMPFTVKFNDEVKVEDLVVDLDKFYEDDGKTDEDDENKDPEDDPIKPAKNIKRTRVWFILGILGLILCIGAADIFLRRRAALAEIESELDKQDRYYSAVKKPKGENGGVYASINDA